MVRTPRHEDKTPANTLPSFTCHGVDLSEHPTEAVGDCPFCGKEGHFYVETKTGRFHCKAGDCDERGNVSSFLKTLWEASRDKTTPKDLEALSEDRGVPVAVLKDWGLALNPLNDDWLILTFPAGGKGRGLPNLYRCFQDDDGKVQVHSTTGCTLQLFRNPHTNKSHASVSVCEGPWDAMALDAIHRSQKGRNAHTIIGLPGANSGHKLLAPLCKGRTVNLLLDHDEAGRKGTAGIIKTLAGSGVGSVRVLRWPDDLPDGFDVRDLLGKKGPRQAFRFIKDHLREEDVSDEAEEEDDGFRLEMVRLHTVKPKKAEWVWPHRIPKHGITTLAGVGGLGKTFVLLDTMARITTGQPFPDGSRSNKADVAIFSAEDDVERVLVPRLLNQRADLSRVHCFTCDNGHDFLRLDKHLGELERWVESTPKLRLAVFDPITSFMGKADIYSDPEVRRIFGPLTTIAQRHDLAIVAIIHENKNEGLSARNRVLGSVAFVNASRAVYRVGKEDAQDDDICFVQVKNNFAPELPGLSYHVSGGQDVHPTLHWNKGTVNVSADSLGTKSSARRKTERLLEWIKSKSKDGRVSSRMLHQAGVIGIKSSDHAKRWLKELAEAGHGMIEDPSRKTLWFKLGGPNKPNKPNKNPTHPTPYKPNKPNRKG